MSSFLGVNSGVLSGSYAPVISNPYTIYVGKHGSDSNAGNTWELAYLTFGAATSAASSGDSIICWDGGTYNERITVPAGVNIIAPNAIFTSPGGGGTTSACFLLDNNTFISVKEIHPGSGEVAVRKADTAGVARVEAEIIDLRTYSAAIGLFNIAFAGAGVLLAKVWTMYVSANGAGVGSTTIDVGHVHLEIEDLYLAGDNARGIVQATNTEIVGRIAHILESGTPSGTLAIDINYGVANLNINTISADTAYDIATNGTLNLFVNSITGSTTGAGTINVTTP